MTVSASSQEDVLRKFRLLWDLHHQSVARFAMRRLPGDDEVADVISDTFLTAWRRIDELEPTTARAWLLATARRQLANRLRGRRRRAALAERVRATATSSPALEVVDADESRTTLAAAFNALPARDREAIALVTWEELEPAEAAEVLEIPASRFRVRLSRAKERLRRNVEHAEQDESSRSPEEHRPVEGIR